jgi:hypothetical protein
MPKHNFSEPQLRATPGKVAVIAGKYFLFPVPQERGRVTILKSVLVARFQ